MNANELADILEILPNMNAVKAAAMLRQQQAEIEALKSTGEPLAWAIKSDGDWTEIGWDDKVLHEVEEWYTAQGWQYEYVPLYTHPAKTLTDAEIVRISETCDLNHVLGLIDFARAILRKAQEK
jgi:hypothetical protein